MAAGEVGIAHLMGFPSLAGDACVEGAERFALSPGHAGLACIE